MLEKCNKFLDSKDIKATNRPKRRSSLLKIFPISAFTDIIKEQGEK